MEKQDDKEMAGFPTAEQIRKVGLEVERLKEVEKNFKLFKAFLRKNGFTANQIKKITPYVFDPKSSIAKLEGGELLVAVFVKFHCPEDFPLVAIPRLTDKREHLHKYGLSLTSWDVAENENNWEVYISILMVIPRTALKMLSKEAEAVIVLYPNPKQNMEDLLQMEKNFQDEDFSPKQKIFGKF